MKIRDLFQRLDLSRSEGRLPEILFDSQGEIDSEDVSCAMFLLNFNSVGPLKFAFVNALTSYICCGRYSVQNVDPKM